MAQEQEQQTLETTLDRQPVTKWVTRKRPGPEVVKKSSPTKLSSSPAAYSAPPSSFLPGSSKKRPAVLSESASSEDQEDSEDSVAALNGKKLRAKTVSSSVQAASEPGSLEVSRDEAEDDEDEDDLPPITPFRRRKRSVVFDASDAEDGVDDDDDDEDDSPIVSSPTKKRKLVNRSSCAAPRPSRASLSGEKEAEEDEENETDAADKEDEVPVAPRSAQRRARRAPRTEKEKARELLRRKRAGEIIEEENLTASSSGEEEAKGLYDTDSENEALVEFDDDEEGIPGSREQSSTKTAKPKTKGKATKQAERGRGSGTDGENLDDFVVEDDEDGALGVPGVLLDIPLEFTAHRHKPLKENFKHAVEWLVQSLIYPSFPQKSHELYKFAWRRLDDEVTGLATSKFTSAAWRKDFYMALRARPYFDSQELAKDTFLERETCGACGRSNHPASFVVKLTGSPYVKQWVRTGEDFLDAVDQEEGSTDSDDDEAAVEDLDEDGNGIPKDTTEWYVGVVCNQNAAMAHDLLHWKRSLLDWVESALQTQGYLEPEKMAETRKMKPRKRDKLVDEIVAKWTDSKTMDMLYKEFKGVIKKARDANTTGNRMQPRWK